MRLFSAIASLLDFSAQAIASCVCLAWPPSPYLFFPVALLGAVKKLTPLNGLGNRLKNQFLRPLSVRRYRIRPFSSGPPWQGISRKATGRSSFRQRYAGIVRVCVQGGRRNADCTPNLLPFPKFRRANECIRVFGPAVGSRAIKLKFFALPSGGRGICDLRERCNVFAAWVAVPNPDCNRKPPPLRKVIFVC